MLKSLIYGLEFRILINIYFKVYFWQISALIESLLNLIDFKINYTDIPGGCCVVSKLQEDKGKPQKYFKCFKLNFPISKSIQIICFKIKKKE